MGGPQEPEGAGAGTLRRLLGRAVTVGWTGLVVVAAWFIWPTSLGGCTTLTIVSGHSMEPTFHTGDLVVARCGPVGVGDVIVYEPPDVGGARVIHRIVGGDESGWVVQGDNNDFLDPWTPTQEHILGSGRFHVPGLGAVTSILISPLTWASVVLLALAVMVWPGRPPEDEQRDPGDDERCVAEPDGRSFRAPPVPTAPTEPPIVGPPPPRRLPVG